MQSVNLGQQFQVNSTGYEIPVKTPDGKTFYDILPELQARFKPSEHREFKTGTDKQGKETYYCYIKWQFIRKRLDDVAGVGGWIIERTGMFIDESGNPCVIGRMNILGVVKESMGIGKAHQAWKGTKIENAIADLLKNCAEEFGIGRYLDDQPGTIQYLWENAENEVERSMARKLAVQYKLQLQAKVSENNAIAAGQQASKPEAKPKENVNIFPDVEDDEPVITDGQKRRLYAIAMKAFNSSKEEYNRFLKARGYKRDRDVLVKDYDALIQALEGMGKNEVVAAPTRKVEAQQQQIYPQHAALFAYFLDLFGVDKEAMPGWLESLFGKPDIGSLGLEQFRKAVREIAIAWAMSNECFVSRVAAEGSYDSVTAADAALGFGMKECIERWRFKALDNSRLATKK